MLDNSHKLAVAAVLADGEVIRRALRGSKSDVRSLCAVPTCASGTAGMQGVVHSTNGVAC
jgi:hypothetical protein